MDFNNFENEFLSQLKKNNEDCIKIIENNEKIVQEYLGNNFNSRILDNFIDKFNEIVIEQNKKLFDVGNKYKLIKKVLNHPLFTNVLSSFKNSNVLLRACKAGNKKAAKWLLTMKVTPYIQDENGISALMYAAQNNMNFVIEAYFKDSECLNLIDNNGENLLFYLIRNTLFVKGDVMNNKIFHNDLFFHSLINVNQYNNKGETPLIYCAKNDIIEPITFLLKVPTIDVNIADSTGKTAPMYLTEKGLFREIKLLVKTKCNYDYCDFNDQSVMSILLQKLYSANKKNDCMNYLKIMDEYIINQVNFNLPIDKDDNTVFMAILLSKDLSTARFCIEKIEKLDLSVKNKYGESATSLIYKLGYRTLLPLTLLKNNPTFDYYYRDPLNQNTLLILSAVNNPAEMKNLLENDPTIINEVNINNENALIVATKINQISVIDILLKYGIYINQQDKLGNTAIHYAIEIESVDIIKKLILKHPDLHLKNKMGKSPLDYANEIQEKKNKKIILDILTNPSKKVSSSRAKLNSLMVKKYKEEIYKYVTPYANHYIKANNLAKIAECRKELYETFDKASFSFHLLSVIS